jgi:hypothetical protein
VALAKTMSCHLAFAQAHGFEAPSCPLYLPGVSLTVVNGGIELRTPSASGAAELRAQARGFFTGSQVLSATVAP